ncbi:TPA: type 1 fimbrial protein [Yersinia enterocolitica]|nr:type 1 fimbrial protein [Yersinia enterocolitica]
MNYLNIRPNTLPKKNRFIWLFFIAASLYSLLSATAYAANCSDDGSTLPGDISLTFHPQKGATPTKVVATQRVKCEITKNDDKLDVHFDSNINNAFLKDKKGRMKDKTGSFIIEYAVNSSTIDNRCKKLRDNASQTYSCDVKSNTSSVIKFEHTIEVTIYQPRDEVSAQSSISLQIRASHIIPGTREFRDTGTLNHSIKVTFTLASCSLNTSNINFDLGKQKLTDFTRIGSTNGWSDTKRIELSCPPDIKYFLQVDGIAEPNHPGVLKLTQEPGAASGVGVQLLANNKEIKIRETKEMGISASSGTNLQEEIDITARYYQTENKVTPGSANASATFTLTYQ